MRRLVGVGLHSISLIPSQQKIASIQAGMSAAYSPVLLSRPLKRGGDRELEPWKLVSLFLAGFATDFIWTASTIGVQTRNRTLLVVLALVWPYIQTLSALVIFDEHSWPLRVLLITVCAVGNVCGLLAALKVFKGERDAGLCY